MSLYGVNSYNLRSKKVQDCPKINKNDSGTTKILLGKRRQISVGSSNSEDSKSFDELLKMLTAPTKRRNFDKNGTKVINLSTPSNSTEKSSFNSIKCQGRISKKKNLVGGKFSPRNSIKKEATGDSFSQLLDYLLTPPKEPKSPHVQTKESSFGAMVNSWLTPTEERPQANPADFTFEQFINQILSPESSQSRNSQLDKQNIKPPKNNKSKNAKKDVDFKDILIQRFNFEEKLSQKSTAWGSNSLKNESFSSNAIPVNTSISKEPVENQVRYPTPDVSRERDCWNLPESPIIGRRVLRKRVLRSSAKDVLNVNKEVSTQTSFDHGVVTLPILNDLEWNVRQTQELATSSNSPRNVVPFNCSTYHCLENLSQSILILPDGRRVLNITEVGTARWLENAVSCLHLFTTSKKKRVPVLETHNCLSLYVNYCSKVELEYNHQGNTKICKIKSTEAPSAELIEVEKPSQIKDRNKLGRRIDKVCANKDLIRSDYEVLTVDSSKICLKIHNIFEKVYDIFENNCVPVVTMKGARKEEFYSVQPSKEHVKKVGTIYVLYRLLYALAKIYTLIQSNTKLTKREIFYQIKHVVKTQRQIDDTINTASHLLGLGPWHLNIISHSGLVYGKLTLTWASGETLSCNLPAVLIPFDLENLVEVRSTASFILVVEKESVYYKLLQEDLPNKLARPFILITGKGLPDLSTRLFLNRISRMLSLPVFIMVDSDVYGIRIMLTYRFGAMTNFHLNDQLAVPNARWLGVYPSEISKYGMECQTLTKTDKRMIESLLKNIRDHPRIAKELEVMLSCNKKASIEGIMKSKTFLSDNYLPMKFFNQDFV